jgi:hypothetical protein
MKPVLNSLAAAVLLALLASASGCVQVQSRPYIGVEAFSPTAPDTVHILRTPPTRPNLRLGEITVEPQNNTSVQTIEGKFRDAAARMGANAVVIVADRTELMGMQETGPWYGAELTPITGRVIVGVAIRYTSTAQPQVRTRPGDDYRLGTAARSGADQRGPGG